MSAMKCRNDEIVSAEVMSSPGSRWQMRAGDAVTDTTNATTLSTVDVCNASPRNQSLVCGSQDAICMWYMRAVRPRVVRDGCVQ